MTDEQKAELHDLLDTLIYAQLSVQPCRREKALRHVEEFVDKCIAEADDLGQRTHALTWHAPSVGNPQ